MQYHLLLKVFVAAFVVALEIVPISLQRNLPLSVLIQSSDADDSRDHSRTSSHKKGFQTKIGSVFKFLIFFQQDKWTPKDP